MPPPDIDRFRKDLAAAITAGVPIRFRGTCTIGDLDRWCAELEAKISLPAEHSIPDRMQATDRLASSGSTIPPRFFAAFKTFVATGSMRPVLDGLTATSTAERQIRRTLRWPFIYLAIVLLIAILGLIFYARHIEPTFTMLQTDLKLPPAVRHVNQVSSPEWLPTAVMAFAIIFLVASIGLLVGGYRSLVMVIGGRRFVQSRQTATAMQILAVLDQAGIDSAAAAEISCELTGGDRLVRNKLASAARDFGTTRPEGQIAFGSSQEQSGQQWSELASYYLATADQKLGYLKVATPAVLLTTIGGAVGLGYGLTIYGPLIRLMRELVSAGI